MRQQLLDELMQVSEEESKYRAGQVAIEEKLYSEVSVQEIYAKGKADDRATTQSVC